MNKQRKILTAKDHTWIICAYRESPYLEECIHSLIGQKVKSKIQIATSTPCEYIAGLAEKYNLDIYVNTGEAGISGDWNYALSTGKTELLTIAHQDDVYESDYTEQLIKRINHARKPILYFTDYGEYRNGQKVEFNRILRIKRIMLVPIRLFSGLKTARRLSLAFGNAICCPSITYLRSAIGTKPFSSRFKSNLDWELTEKISKKTGQFIFCPRIMMYHRIHDASTTTEIIGNHQRILEDYEMMKKFWPNWIAKWLSKAYSSSEKSNNIDS